jgi:nucleoside 2-deoxyribosyltransferase
VTEPTAGTRQRILVIGDVFVDYHLDLQTVRLGGIAHAARALSALPHEWAVAVISPDYLDTALEAIQARATLASRVGTVVGAPNLIVVRDSPEAGSQGYDDVLRDSREVEFDRKSLEGVLDDFSPSDILVFPGSFDLVPVLQAAGKRGRLAVDAQYAVGLPTALLSAGTPLETLFLSTSCPLFRDEAGEDVSNLRSLVPPELARNIILKENRGGSRVLAPGGEVEAGAYLAATLHSVGVGDCFDVVWIAHEDDPDLGRRLNRSSYVAGLYASTSDDSIFESRVHEALRQDRTIAELRGKRLPWEDRPDRMIYVAAPDFPTIDTKLLDELEEALRYHNFSVIRPVRDYGLVDDGTTRAERATIYQKDVAGIEASALMIAVPLVPDPGTFVEMGIAAKCQIPIVLYDSIGATANMFARETATMICAKRSEVVDGVFSLLGRTPP